MIVAIPSIEGAAVATPSTAATVSRTSAGMVSRTLVSLEPITVLLRTTTSVPALAVREGPVEAGAHGVAEHERGGEEGDAEHDGGARAEEAALAGPDAREVTVSMAVSRISR